MSITLSNPVISISPPAAAHIKQLIQQSPNCKGFRLSVKKGGCTGFSYVPELVEVVNEHDLHSVHEEGFSVFVPQDALDILRGTQLNLEIKEMGQSQLVYQNPNANKTCGCGISFQAEKQNHENS